MLFIVHAVDRTDALPTRLENYDAHKAFLSDTGRFGVKIVMSGPLVGDDNKTMIGSFFLVEAPSRYRGRGLSPFRSVLCSRDLEDRDDHGLSAPAGVAADSIFGSGIQHASPFHHQRLT